MVWHMACFLIHWRLAANVWEHEKTYGTLVCDYPEISFRGHVHIVNVALWYV
jgi:hypothetical protein